MLLLLVFFRSHWRTGCATCNMACDMVRVRCIGDGKSFQSVLENLEGVAIENIWAFACVGN